MFCWGLGLVTFESVQNLPSLKLHGSLEIVLNVLIGGHTSLPRIVRWLFKLKIPVFNFTDVSLYEFKPDHPLWHRAER